MTEIESHLFEALKQLQTTYEQHQKTWEESYNSLQAMYETTQKSNETIREKLKATLIDNEKLAQLIYKDNERTRLEMMKLEKQLNSLSRQLKR